MIETEEYTITVEENKESPSNETVDYVGILACAIEVAENVTIEFGLVTIYESFEPQFLLHLASFQNCSSVGDADVVQACFERESEAASKTFEKFLGLVQEVMFEFKGRTKVDVSSMYFIFLSRKMKKLQMQSLDCIIPSASM